ncbi:4Fe-4S dicluster domain-containing protein [Gordonia amicalis]|uniref:4Fe-4S dicluster domain-containing protein n=1 Tax=Gordonia amicalis TaxID=89053 RepID=UPI0022A65E51|nr:4Fe-4S dicluster domain-containing protein [Gordonia amicalis]MCZ0914797.1 4Fe-4S dicluster domain-containing protein [Gordonia amicalis]
MRQLSGPTDPTSDVGWHTHETRKGFFTDTSICIGCKACEVACKEWNSNPRDGDLELTGMSYDNTVALGASTWRHVAFIEQSADRIAEARESGRALVGLGMPSMPLPPAEPHSPPPSLPADPHSLPPAEPAPSAARRRVEATPPPPPPAEPAPSAARRPVEATPPDTPEFRWLMSSDVCKHCTHAGCLDVCPTGALFRTEFGTVVIQDDVCNGCGTCVAGCPFGVVERRADGTAAPTTRSGERKGEQPEVPKRGVAQKCTLCYDRLLDDETPACAQTCPTTSIKYGDHDDLVADAHRRVAQLHEQGMTEARLYGANPNDGVGGTGSVFLLLDEPEVYGLPPDPRVCTADLPSMYKRAGVAAVGMLAAAAVSFLRGGR